jgi:D-methionine transport system substrate-binding protein
VVKKVAARDGLEIQTVVFSDYLQPNAALASGDLDANAFQHRPYLESQTARGYKIVPVGLTITAPLGIYSRKFKSVDQLPNGAGRYPERSFQRQPRAPAAAEGRPDQAKPGVGENGVNATPLDIIDNPRKLKLIELDAAQLPRSLDDLTAA